MRVKDDAVLASLATTFLEEQNRSTAASFAELAADALRSAIASGQLRPGAHLREDLLSKAFGISRNTLREAFRVLSLEGLIEHFPNRGVFVRVVGTADIEDLFLIRTALETSALKIASKSRETDLTHLTETLERAVAAAAAEEWEAVGREDIEFHRAIVGLAASPRLSAAMDRVLLELQLVFYAVEDEAAFYGHYVDRNWTIGTLLVARDWRKAATELRSYLSDSLEETRSRSLKAHDD